MQCPNCGAEVGKSKYCSFCGSNITAKMLREQERLNMKGCPSCGSTNIQFRRENHGEVRGKSSKQVIYRTVGFCKDCGATWYPNQSDNVRALAKPKKTWLWILGWIFIFPIPLTILVLRKKDMKPILKYGIIVVGCLIYLAIAKSCNSDIPSKPAEPTPSVVAQESESDFSSFAPTPEPVASTPEPVASTPEPVTPTPEPTEELTTQFDVIDYFIEQYNSIAEYPMTDPLDIDIKAPEHYRVEYRLNAFNYSIARQYTINGSTIDIVLYGGLSEGHNDSIRFYLTCDDKDFASLVLVPMLKVLDPTLTDEEIAKGVEYIKQNGQGYYLNTDINFYCSTHLFLDCANLDFYNNK